MDTRELEQALVAAERINEYLKHSFTVLRAALRDGPALDPVNFERVGTALGRLGAIEQANANIIEHVERALRG